MSLYTISFIRDSFDKSIIISSKRDFNKSRQVIMKSENLNKENGEEIDEKVVFIASAINHNNPSSMILILNFS